MAQQSKSKDDQTNGVYLHSLRIVASTITNPLFLFGVLFGSVAGGALCWIIIVLPFQDILRQREVQLEEWSRLNMQMLELAKDTRGLTQEELKRYVTLNQETAIEFQEVQRHLHERELRMTQTPTSYILIPVAILAFTCIGIVFLFMALNQRAMATIEHVVHLAPREMVQEVLNRHILLNEHSPPRLAQDGANNQESDA